MTIRVSQKNLISAIGTDAAREMWHAAVVKVSFPFLHVVDQQRKVIATMLSNQWVLFIADQVQFLVGSQAKPGARKRKGGTSNRLELEHVAIKGYASFDVRHVNRYMIELQGSHERHLRRERKRRQRGIVPYAVAVGAGSK